MTDQFDTLFPCLPDLCRETAVRHVFLAVADGRQPFPVPREMTVEDIKTCVDQFRQGALNCIKAGFDGVEVRSVFAK